LFLDEKVKTDNYYIDGFIQYLHKLADDLLPEGFKKYGIKEKDLEKICRNTEIKNNPVKLNEDDLAEILQTSL
jgi:alcohol dehydrogenase class IV